MQLPIKAHYATVAMLALAKEFNAGDLVSAKSISIEYGIPNQFLVQILQQLRSAGLVSSSRGPNGGFKLDKPPHCIVIADILDVICPTSPNLPDGTCSNLLNEVVHDVWRSLETLQQDFLKGQTLDDLLLRMQNSAQPMFFI
ncbi:MAG: Rrf2 family transcriptional regulator [Planctomycetales bacterium]|nr:Rrf2 family transcriptional regulator [Planctomycetales bacterium]